MLFSENINLFNHSRT